ncbi:uncharacterized protein LOC106070750 [Biomphalaria glabrata]|uniref:Uncharacterized protein LOC106070750 n=1 Tax=Biomphalaria glabrata TaxID=6526 RepID=A0A9W3B054_BIOGL|nr:uncharacterized protein LOC106070750 [Biomphalaria glabrata]XP_055892862.1 uncharacterized protein LOC106070750 [Biomphalaria glabrata]XP_055892863.1 uncharacterized protein LOC106070750 [Biomphalaria glabrata]
MELHTILMILLPVAVLGQVDLNALARDTFYKMDVSQDGLVTRIELAGYFNRMDQNGDAKISKHEYTDYITDIYGHSPDLNHYVHTIYDNLDYNNDHHVDQLDYNRNFDRADTNFDDFVDEDEFNRLFMALAQ